MNDTVPEIVTDRLRLTPFSHTDFNHFVREMLNDPDVMRFYHSYTSALTTDERRAKARADFLDHFETSREQRGYETWALHAREAMGSEPGSFVGWAGVVESPIAPAELGPELQYMVASRYHGQGLATEAAAAVLDDAFLRCQVGRLRAYVDAPNVGSRRVLEKLGFRLEGQVTAYGSDDMVWYSLNADVRRSTDAIAPAR